MPLARLRHYLNRRRAKRELREVLGMINGIECPRCHAPPGVPCIDADPGDACTVRVDAAFKGPGVYVVGEPE